MTGGKASADDLFIQASRPSIVLELIERVRAAEAKAALMAERASLIETKRDQIERLTAERDAALAKVTQYEQALSRIDRCYASEYAGRVYEYCTCCGACVSEGGKHSDTCIWPVMPDDDINLIARPEVTK